MSHMTKKSVIGSAEYEHHQRVLSDEACDRLGRELRETRGQRDALRDVLGDVLGDDLAGRPFSVLLQEAADLLEQGGGGPVVDCLRAKADVVESALSAPEPAELRTEIERLRAELQTSRERHAADGRDLDQLRITARDESQRAHEAEVALDHAATQHVAIQAELERTQAELVHLRGIQREWETLRPQMAEEISRISNQRNALADALLRMRNFPAGEDRSGVIAQADSALELAGRLP